MLWFKNVIIYRLNRDIAFSTDALEKQLSEFAFTPAEARISLAPVGYPRWALTVMH